MTQQTHLTDPAPPGYPGLGYITPDPLYGVTLTLGEGRILVEHRVPPNDDNITGNTMHRTQDCAGPAVEIAFQRYLDAYDRGIIGYPALRDFAAGAAEAIVSGRIGDYAFDKLAELETLFRLVRGL